MFFYHLRYAWRRLLREPGFAAAARSYAGAVAKILSGAEIAGTRARPGK